jgi:hypothetical protein
MAVRSKEKISAVIVSNGCQMSFTVHGSVIGGVAEVFGWLPPERREAMLERLQKDHAKLSAAEAERAAQPIPSQP